ARGRVARQPREIAGVPTQLGSDPVIGMPADREGKDDDPGREMANVLYHDASRRIVVLEVRVREAGVAALGDAEELGGLGGLAGPQVRAAAGAALAGSEIQNRSPVSRVGGAEEGARASKLDIVPMGGYRQDIHRHGA